MSPSRFRDPPDPSRPSPLAQLRQREKDALRQQLVDEFGEVAELVAIAEPDGRSLALLEDLDEDFFGSGQSAVAFASGGALAIGSHTGRIVVLDDDGFPAVSLDASCGDLAFVDDDTLLTVEHGRAVTWSISAQRRTSETSLMPFVAVGGGSWCSTDGRHVVTETAEGLHIIRVGDDEPFTTTRALGAGVSQIEWSPTATRFLCVVASKRPLPASVGNRLPRLPLEYPVVSKREVLLHDLVDGEVAVADSFSTLPVTSAIFVTDDEILLDVGGRLVLHDVATGTVDALWAMPDRWRLLGHRGGRVAIANDRIVSIVDLRRGNAVASVELADPTPPADGPRPRGPWPASRVRWSPDGGLLAVLRQRTGGALFEVDG